MVVGLSGNVLTMMPPLPLIYSVPLIMWSSYMAFLFATVHSTTTSNYQGKSLGDSPYELDENYVRKERQSLCTYA